MICDIWMSYLSIIIFAIHFLMKWVIDVIFYDKLIGRLDNHGSRKYRYFFLFPCAERLFSWPISDESSFRPIQISQFPRSFTVEIYIVKLESSLKCAYVPKAKSSWTGVTLESMTRQSERMILMFMWLLEQLQAIYRNNYDCSESNSCNILLAAPAVRYARHVPTPRRLCISVFCE